jgi:hypothetical protein
MNSTKLYPIYNEYNTDLYDLLFNIKMKKRNKNADIKNITVTKVISSNNKLYILDESGNPFTASLLKTTLSGKFIPYLSEIIPILETAYKESKKYLNDFIRNIKKKNLIWKNYYIDIKNFLEYKQNSLLEEDVVINYQSLKNLMSGVYYKIYPWTALDCKNSQHLTNENISQIEVEKNYSQKFSQNQSTLLFDEEPAMPLQYVDPEEENEEISINNELKNYWENLSDFSEEEEKEEVEVQDQCISQEKFTSQDFRLLTDSEI